ncbi:MAG TPA: hypothetical protein VFW47_05510 [Phenylobacterium sp.]|nr:hypothetical protein [Phenylobacterium sp.]
MLRPQIFAALAAAAAALTLAACAERTRPPGDVEVCFHVQPQRDGSLKYNRLPSKQKDLEHCAGALEAMRLRFLSMGGTQREIVGAYQGNFIFLQRDGIFTAPSLEEHRYLALVRTGDGRLAIPGAMPRE